MNLFLLHSELICESKRAIPENFHATLLSRRWNLDASRIEETPAAFEVNDLHIDRDGLTLQNRELLTNQV